jgi:hypothetical protein
MPSTRSCQVSDRLPRVSPQYNGQQGLHKAQNSSAAVYALRNDITTMNSSGEIALSEAHAIKYVGRHIRLLIDVSTGSAQMYASQTPVVYVHQTALIHTPWRRPQTGGLSRQMALARNCDTILGACQYAFRLYMAT